VLLPLYCLQPLSVGLITIDTGLTGSFLILQVFHIMARETTRESTPAAAMPASMPALGSDGKPIKLRAACNSCFSAKVRCDGNKDSCKRCIDKHLKCVYSESRVGKVVGKRRKRPIDDSIGTVDSEAWVVHQQQSLSNSIPSPAATTSSAESSSKRHCNDNSWTYFLADEAQSLLDCNEAGEALQSIDMADQRSYSASSESIFCNNGGLQTPSLSPPNFRYLSPAALDVRPVSRQHLVPSITSRSRISNQSLVPPGSRQSSPPSAPEDEETVCIKLLAHLKKYSSSSRQTRQFQLDLLSKSNASVRRILRSQSVRRDYTCQLLLSSIMTHLTTLCEYLCSTGLEEGMGDGQSSPRPDSTRESFDMRTGLVQQQTSSETSRPLVLEAASLATELGNLLKRKPLDGFQVQGRQEAWIVELELRLRTALTTL